MRCKKFCHEHGLGHSVASIEETAMEESAFLIRAVTAPGMGRGCLGTRLLTGTAMASAEPRAPLSCSSQVQVRADRCYPAVCSSSPRSHSGREKTMFSHSVWCLNISFLLPCCRGHRLRELLQQGAQQAQQQPHPVLRHDQEVSGTAQNRDFSTSTTCLMTKHPVESYYFFHCSKRYQ